MLSAPDYRMSVQGGRVVRSEDGPIVSDIFGITKTPLLIYLAVHPGCTSQNIRAVVEVSSGSLWHTLHDMSSWGIMCGHRHYSINPNLKNFYELRAFLKCLAKLYGIMPVNDKIGPLPSIELRHASPSIPITSKIIFGALRRDILTALACLRESYGMELSTILPHEQSDIQRGLHYLETEGFLWHRIVGSAHLYSYATTSPGPELLTLVRRMGFDSADVRAGVQSILLRREMQKAQSPRGTGKTALVIEQPAHHIEGTRRFRALEVRRQFVNLRNRRRARLKSPNPLDPRFD